MTHALGDRICTPTTDAWTDVNRLAAFNCVLLYIFSGNRIHWLRIPRCEFLGEEIKRVIEKVDIVKITAVVKDNCDEQPCLA
ncbi:hypothetical protein PHMEG_00029330 [Phytophthora megakarya]|uniref:Uncharacterized protein n=1 Tax=Phytophthora megakarya TaxID=4795 RepID=A0A225V5F6_9STRA|nr:hypothetical protein PHMEG_00029330 [Phytophthora megakarya]